MLAGVRQRLADGADQRVGHVGRHRRQVRGQDDPGAGAVAVLEQGGRRPQPRPDLATAADRRGRLEQVLPQLPLLLVGQPHDVLVGGPPLHHGQGLQHPVVQGAGDLLPGLGPRDQPLGLPQLQRDQAGGRPRQGVQHHRRQRRHQLTALPGEAGLDEVVGHVAEADDRPGDESATAGEDDPGADDAGQRPHRPEHLGVGDAVVGQLVADGQREPDRHLAGDHGRPGEQRHVASQHHGGGGGHDQGDADQQVGDPGAGGRIVELRAAHHHDHRHPRPRQPPEHRHAAQQAPDQGVLTLGLDHHEPQSRVLRPGCAGGPSLSVEEPGCGRLTRW